jgi:hypothetical protein
VATKSKSIGLFLEYMMFSTGRQRWVDLWDWADAEKCILKVQASKELCLGWDQTQKHVWVWDHRV